MISDIMLNIVIEYPISLSAFLNNNALFVEKYIAAHKYFIEYKYAEIQQNIRPAPHTN